MYTLHTYMHGFEDNNQYPNKKPQELVHARIQKVCIFAVMCIWTIRYTLLKQMDGICIVFFFLSLLSA